MKKVLTTGLIIFGICSLLFSQKTTKKMTDTNTPLHALQPEYDVFYGVVGKDDVAKVLKRVYNYLDETTPAKLVNKETGEEITNYKKPVKEAVLAQGDFRLISYEWGVTYAGMLNASQATGDKDFEDYVSSRLTFIAQATDYFHKYEEKFDVEKHSFRSVLHPHALDDAGAMCAAMIKAESAGLTSNLDPIIKNYMDWVFNKQFRLEDGTLARNRPQKNTLWLDDLFMSVPALAQMGKYTGDVKYFDDAVKQVKLFSDRMFNNQNRLYMHGWVQEMETHPQFHWARANGWAIMTKVELLDVLPADHPGRPMVIELLKKHIAGLASYQSGKGFWHQLIDKNDSYLETSATAIYTYSIAKAINEGWIDAVTYGPMVLLGWNAVASMVNEEGQVEGTCVGTGMAFDPAFYYYRPINVYAAHGYGPVLLAGAEIIKLIENNDIKMNDSSVQVYK